MVYRAYSLPSFRKLVVTRDTELGSVVKTAVRNLITDYRLTDSVQTGSHDTFLSRFALSYGMT